MIDFNSSRNLVIAAAVHRILVLLAVILARGGFFFWVWTRGSIAATLGGTANKPNLITIYPAHFFTVHHHHEMELRRSFEFDTEKRLQDCWWEGSTAYSNGPLPRLIAVYYYCIWAFYLQSKHEIKRWSMRWQRLRKSPNGDVLSSKKKTSKPRFRNPFKLKYNYFVVAFFFKQTIV